MIYLLRKSVLRLMMYFAIQNLMNVLTYDSNDVHLKINFNCQDFNVLSITFTFFLNSLFNFKDVFVNNFYTNTIPQKTLLSWIYLYMYEIIVIELNMHGFSLWNFKCMRLFLWNYTCLKLVCDTSILWRTADWNKK